MSKEISSALQTGDGNGICDSSGKREARSAESPKTGIMVS